MSRICFPKEFKCIKTQQWKVSLSSEDSEDGSAFCGLFGWWALFSWASESSGWWCKLVYNGALIPSYTPAKSHCCTFHLRTVLHTITSGGVVFLLWRINGKALFRQSMCVYKPAPNHSVTEAASGLFFHLTEHGFKPAFSHTHASSKRITLLLGYDSGLNFNFTPFLYSKPMAHGCDSSSENRKAQNPPSLS